MIRKSITLLVLILLVNLSLFINAYAAEEPPVYVTQDELQSIIENHNDSIKEKDKIISDLLTENKDNQNRIETLYSIFSTWTAIILAICALLGIVFPVVLPYALSRHYQKEMRKLRQEFEASIEKKTEKAMMLNNALSYAASGDYWVAVECLKKLQKEHPNDGRIKIYIAEFSFKNIEKMLHQFQDNPVKRNEIIKEERENLINIISMFYSIYEMKQSDIKDELMIGSVFYGSIIHELAFIESWLNEIVDSYGYNNHISIQKKILKIIETELGISRMEDLFCIDQTHVFLMSYKTINYHMSVLYHKHKSILAVEQIKLTIRLYTADDFLQSPEELAHCYKMLSELEMSEIKG